MEGNAPGFIHGELLFNTWIVLQSVSHLGPGEVMGCPWLPHPLMDKVKREEKAPFMSSFVPLLSVA